MSLQCAPSTLHFLTFNKIVIAKSCILRGLVMPVPVQREYPQTVFYVSVAKESVLFFLSYVVKPDSLEDVAFYVCRF